MTVATAQPAAGSVTDTGPYGPDKDKNGCDMVAVGDGLCVAAVENVTVISADGDAAFDGVAVDDSDGV